MKISLKLLNVCVSIFIFIALLITSAQSVYATATLQLDDGTTIKTIADGSTAFGLIDMDPRSGIVMWSGLIGDFDFEVTVGSTKPYISGLPEIDLFDVSGNSTSSGMLDIWFSETGFSGIGSPANVVTTVGGTTDDQVEFYSYIDNSDTLFGQGTQTAHLGPYVDFYDPSLDPPLGFSGTVSSNVSISSPFSITALATITHGSSGDITSFDMDVKVAPEPISSTLFIVGALTMGFRCFRKNRS